MQNQIVNWTGEDGRAWRAELGILNGTPSIRSLAYESNGAWITLAADLVPQFKVVTAKRTKINPQREKALAPGEELDYQWDTYSDDPFSHKENVRQSDSTFAAAAMEMTQEGGHTTVTFDGLTLGQFAGGVEFHFFNGSNLIRMEAVAATEEDGVAYLYHAGLDGFEIGKLYYVSPKRREVLENPGLHTNSGPDRDRQRVDARGRVLTLGLTNGSVAAFPSPHRFFWCAQTENNVGFNYYILRSHSD